MQKLTQQQLDQLTNEMNAYMEETGRKLFPVDKADELATYGAKRCSKCTSVKLIEEFGKDSRARDGLMGRCKTCNCANTANYYQRNTDKELERHRNYRAANREKRNEYFRTQWATDELYRLRVQLNQGYYRAVEEGNDAEWIEPEQLLTWWDAKGIDPLTCYLTGESLTPFDRSIDHVVAISNGGGHTVDNLMPCTFEANLRKHNLSPSDAREKLTNN